MQFTDGSLFLIVITAKDYRASMHDVGLPDVSNLGKFPDDALLLVNAIGGSVYALGERDLVVSSEGKAMLQRGVFEREIAAAGEARFECDEPDCGCHTSGALHSTTDRAAPPMPRAPVRDAAREFKRAEAIARQYAKPVATPDVAWTPTGTKKPS